MKVKIKAISICALILSLLVSGCGAGQLLGPTSTPKPLSTTEPTITPAQTTTSTFTPTSTPTSIPTPTPAPLGVDLDYSVVVSDYHSISITITISNISSSDVILYRLASPSLDAIPFISKIDIVNGDGKGIDYKLDKWQGEADRHLQILDLNTGDAKKAVLSYTLDLSSQKYWEITPKYIAVAENQVLFQPDPDHLAIAKMHFTFSVPNNWHVITRLTPVDDGYIANIKDTFRVVTYNHEWQRFFFAAPLVLGEFDKIESQYKNIRLLAAYPTGNAQYANDATYVGKIFSLQESLFGNPSLDKDDYAILYVFGPKIPNGAQGGLIPTVVNHGTFETAHVNEDRHLGHEMYHMWWGDGNFEPDSWRFMRVPSWFSEGGNEYLVVDP